MDLKVYEATTEELAALAKKLPPGRLYSNGKGFVPNVRQNLYSRIIVELAAQPQAAVGKDNDDLPVATSLPRARYQCGQMTEADRRRARRMEPRSWRG